MIASSTPFFLACKIKAHLPSLAFPVFKASIAVLPPSHTPSLSSPRLWSQEGGSQGPLAQRALCLCSSCPWPGLPFPSHRPSPTCQFLSFTQASPPPRGIPGSFPDPISPALYASMTALPGNVLPMPSAPLGLLLIFLPCPHLPPQCLIIPGTFQGSIFFLP